MEHAKEPRPNVKQTIWIYSAVEQLEVFSFWYTNWSVLFFLILFFFLSFLQSHDYLI